MKEKAEPVQKLYTRMRLWEFPDEYVIEPTDGSSASSSLSISLVDASMKLIGGLFLSCLSFYASLFNICLLIYWTYLSLF